MFFDDVAEAKPDPVFGMMGTFRADKRPRKVNLMVGIYHDEKLQTRLISAVKKAKEEIKDLMADYLPMEGLAGYVEKVGELAFGEALWKEHRERIFGAQTPGGTGALRVGAEFLRQEVSDRFAVSQPTWPNHFLVFERAGCKVETYPYYDKEKHGVDFAALRAFCEKAPERSVVILHVACHNPTGCDLTIEEWKELSQILKKKRIFPFFDFAYQGFGEGIAKDRKALEIFLEDGHEMLVCYSCSKNFSLYCQRVGALFVVSGDAATKQRVGSQIKRTIRALYSNPPAHGAMIVAHVLETPLLKKEWEQELEEMRKHLVNTRNAFVEKLLAKRPDFNYLKRHKGMFSFFDLEKKQVHRLIEDFAIYLLDNGRINIAGLTKDNMDNVVKSFLAVCE